MKIALALTLALLAGAAVASLVQPPPLRICAIDSDCPCGYHCEGAIPLHNTCGQIAGYSGGSCVPDCNDLGTECLK